jgi:hypothetical protein
VSGVYFQNETPFASIAGTSTLRVDGPIPMRDYNSDLETVAKSSSCGAWRKARWAGAERPRVAPGSVHAFVFGWISFTTGNRAVGTPSLEGMSLQDHGFVCAPSPHADPGSGFAAPE